jgi:hypothetical protein
MTGIGWLVDRGRAALWAARAARAARTALAERGLEALALPPVPPLPPEAGWAASGALRLWSRNCLVRAAVRQAWEAAHGRRRELVIGVTAPGPGFRAHAWLDGDPPAASRGYRELARRPPP